jgi:hypothetical protein
MSDLDDTAAFLEEVARLAATVRGQLWRDIGIEATKRAKALRAAPELPRTPNQVIDFLGGDFHSIDYGREEWVATDDTVISLSIHDLLSAFRRLGEL